MRPLFQSYSKKTFPLLMNFKRFHAGLNVPLQTNCRGHIDSEDRTSGFSYFANWPSVLAAMSKNHLFYDLLNDNSITNAMLVLEIWACLLHYCFPMYRWKSSWPWLQMSILKSVRNLWWNFRIYGFLKSRKTKDVDVKTLSWPFYVKSQDTLISEAMLWKEFSVFHRLIFI